MIKLTELIKYFILGYMMTKSLMMNLGKRWKNYWTNANPEAKHITFLVFKSKI